MVERARPARRDDVEAGEVAARTAAVPGRDGAITRQSYGRPRRWPATRPGGTNILSPRTNVRYGERVGSQAQILRYGPPTRPEPLPGFTAATAAPPPRRPRPRSTTSARRCREVTFVVVDLETTGGSPATDAITEIGALKLRGGECLGAFETLVNPGVPIPPLITVLTGITEAMVLPAPRIDEVLPAFLEFLGDAVIVGHNIRFDVSFLDAALRRERSAPARQPPGRHHRPRPPARARRGPEPEAVDAGAPLPHADRAGPPRLRRRRGDGRTVARAARAGRVVRRPRARRPARAADDPCAPVGREARRSPRACPAQPGVYVFRDRGGRVLYVGKAANLAHACPLLLLGRRSPEGAAAAARGGRDRPSRLSPDRSRPRSASCG